MNTPAPPNPGSKEATARGCVCPIWDNHLGKGRSGDGARFGWWVHTNCPLHGTKEPSE